MYVTADGGGLLPSLHVQYSTLLYVAYDGYPRSEVHPLRWCTSRIKLRASARATLQELALMAKPRSC